MSLSPTDKTTVRINGTDHLLLTTDNYPRWKASALETFKGLSISWLIRTDGKVTTQEKAWLADALGTAAIAKTDTAAAITAIAPKYSDEYIKADRVAADFIYKTCCVQYQDAISSLDSAILRWEFLANLGQGSDLSAKHKHFTSLLNTNYQSNNGTCLNGLTVIKNTSLALKDIYREGNGQVMIPLNDLELVGAVSYLEQIPKFQLFVSLLLRSGESWDLEKIARKAIEEEGRLNSVPMAEALNTKVITNGNLPENPKKLPHHCSEHGWTWHPTEKCFKLYPELKKDRKKDSSSNLNNDVKSLITQVLKNLAKSEVGEEKEVDLNKKVKNYVDSSLDPISMIANIRASQNWIIDSGSSHIMSKINPKTSRDLLTTIQTANGSMLSSKIGNIPIFINGKYKTTFKEVLYCSEIAENLISVSTLCDTGYAKVTFTQNGWEAQHKHDSNLNLSGPRNGNLYVMNADNSTPKTYAAVSKKDLKHFINQKNIAVNILNGMWNATDCDGTIFKGDISDSNLLLLLHRSRKAQMKFALNWHDRLGHINLADLKLLVKTGQIQGLNSETFDLSIKELDCPHCLIGKMREANIPHQSTLENKAQSPGDRISCDLTGPIRQPTFGGSRYLLTFTDQFSKYRWGFLLSSKHLPQIIKCYEIVKRNVKTFWNKNIKFFRSDNEFNKISFINLLQMDGTIPEFTIRYNSFQNGQSERGFLSIFNLARTALSQSKLPPKFWGYAVMHSIYALNECLPSNSSNQSPHEVYFKTKPYVAFLRPFGATCYICKPSAIRNGKLDERGIEAIY